MAEYPCEICPARLFPEPDECTQLTIEAWNLLQESLSPEHPPALEFVFKLLGVEIGSEQSREIYRRLLMTKKLKAEYDQLTQPPEAEKNGHGAS